MLFCYIHLLRCVSYFLMRQRVQPSISLVDVGMECDNSLNLIAFHTYIFHEKHPSSIEITDIRTQHPGFSELCLHDTLNHPAGATGCLPCVLVLLSPFCCGRRCTPCGISGCISHGRTEGRSHRGDVVYLPTFSDACRILW